MQKIIGYHGTKKRFAESIIKEGFKIASPKENDNHWLGHGIYFYSDYELAEWWGKTKVNKHNEKYGYDDVPVVIKGDIESENIWDLDKPFMLRKFKQCQMKLEKEFVDAGIIIDFSKKNTATKIRCFWMDYVKENYNIEVIIYTFTKENPSYIESKYHVRSEDRFSLGTMGLAYHEKQICVTEDRFVVNKYIVNDIMDEFEEVII